MQDNNQGTAVGAEYLKMTFCSNVYDVAEVTPLELMEKTSERLNNTILVKREDRQTVHSFKIRGAQAMLSNLTEAERKTGVIAASAGNHAQGVALAATKLGIDSLIVMPITTPNIKVDAVKSFGGKVYLYGENFDEAKKKAIELSASEGRTFIPPFDHPLVIAGQGTIAMELLQQYAKVDRVFVPVGGGGLAAGVAVIIKQLMPSVKIIAVESEDSACLNAALKAGEPVDLDRVGLFAEGVAVKRIGDESFKLCKEYVDDIVIVDSDEICAAVKDIFDDVRAVAEPSGALALAGLKKYVEQHNIKNENLIHVLSGANVNFHTLRYVSERCELGEKKEALFAVTIPEEKGSFLRFSEILGDYVITEFNYRYHDNEKAAIFVGVKVSGDDEKLEIIKRLSESNYPVTDLSDDEMAKLHVRYMIGGKPCQEIQEQVYSFEFPEFKGALLKFLKTLGTHWNITLFHYRSHGTDYGRVLAGFQLDGVDLEFKQHLSELNYECHDETNNPSLRFFITK